MRMKPLTVKPGVLNIGLPVTHYELHGIQQQDKTGALASPSNQGQTLTCASHAVGKAVLEILDSVGWDADQNIIIDTLIKKFQPDHEPENPDVFNEGTVKVHITNKEDKSKAMDIEVEIGIQRQTARKVEPHAYTNTSPTVTNLEENRLRIVLDWDWFDYSDGKYKPHAVYAKKYSTVTEKYSCINS